MQKPVEPKKILCIHDLSGVGRCSLAVILPAGAMMATQSKRQMRRNVRKVMKGAENAVMQLDKMATDFVEKHIDC